jgi:hypothetical protein
MELPPNLIAFDINDEFLIIYSPLVGFFCVLLCFSFRNALQKLF